MRKRSTQQFWAAFSVSLIAIGAVWAFLLVDLDLGGHIGMDVEPILQVSAINSEGVRFAAFGEAYAIRAADLTETREFFWQARGLLPASTLVAGNLTAKGYQKLREHAEERREELPD